MARISSYPQDSNLSGEDRLVGSSYEGEGQNGPIYKTRTYKLSELISYFSGELQVGGGGLNLTEISQTVTEISQTVTDNSIAIATANQSLVAITNEFEAYAAFTTNLFTSFVTYDSNGNIISVAEAFADQVLEATSSDRFAEASFTTNLASSLGVFDEEGNLITLAEAFANQVLSVTTTDLYATAQFATNLAASFGTYNADGTLATISEAFANQLLQASTASDFANATFLTNLASSFGTFDEQGNLVSISESYADQLLATANTSSLAEASFVTNLASSLGTYNPDGSIATLSTSFADQVLSTANTTEFAQASFVTNLVSAFGTADALGNLVISEAFANEVLDTASTATYAESSFVQNLGASFGTVNVDGSVSFSNTSNYANEILNYVDSSSALASQIATLEATVTNIPVTIRQPDQPDTTAYPEGSIWIDTDDANSVYILVGGVWQATTSEALGDLILSNAQLEQQVNLLSTDLSAEATKLDTLTAQFGVYDPVTNQFTINNNANVIQDLRTYADSESAAASKTDAVISEFGSYDPGTGTFTTSTAKFQSIVDTLTLSNYASTSRVDTLEVEVDGNKADILLEQTARITGDAALTSQIQTLQAQVDANGASITEEQSARVSADQANATYSLNIASSIGTVDANGNIIAVSEAFANSIINTETTASYATTTQIDTLSAAIDDNAALIQQESIARADADTAFTSQISSVTSTVGGLSTTVQQHTTSINGIEGRYGVTIDANGNIAGFQLLNGQGGSSFNVSVDAFNIYSGTSGTQVFAVDAGQVKLNVPLNGVSGTFTGTLDAGDVSIANNTITVGGLLGSMVFTDTSNVAQGSISAAAGYLSVSAPGQANITSGNAQVYVSGTAGVASMIANGANMSLGSLGGEALISANDRILLTTGSNSLLIDSTGVFANGIDLSAGGGGTGTDTNYYLNGITKSGNTLTFNIVGTTDVSYTFGANAFTSDALTFTQFSQYEAASITSLDTDRWNEAYGWGNHASVGYLTAANVTSFIDQTELNSALSGYATTTELLSYATKAYVDSSIPDLTGYATESYVQSSLTPYATQTYVNNAIPTVGNGTITIIGGGVLGGSGSFSMNQTGNATITISHDASAQGSVSNSGGTVIQSVNVDGYGHISGITSVNLDGRYLTSLPAHTHDDRYYTESEINSILSSYVSTAALNTALSSYVTQTSLSTTLGSYATTSYVNSVVPSSSQESQWTAAYNFSVFGGTVSGNLYANDFILNSDASLKENVVDYAVKPINIAYKEYSFIGTQDKRVGVIAQELEVDHPEFIRESGLGKKSVSYIDLLLAKVAELEQRIKQLENGSTT